MDVPGVAESGDEFGAACTLVDTDGDGHRDRAVSSTAENASAGALCSLRGTTEGVRTQDSTAVGAPVTRALFGSFLR